MKISLRERIAFGTGSFSLELVTMTLSTYLMLYHTNILGLAPGVSGTMFLVARFVDAVTDLAMANVADRTRTRFGSYRPFLLIGAVPIGLIFALNFLAPGSLTDTGKLVWAYVTYFLTGSVMATFLGVPYGSLNSVMSASRDDRTRFASARSIGSHCSHLIIQGVTMTIILAFGTVNDRAGWQVVAVAYGIVAALGFFFCFSGTRERIPLPEKKKTPLSESFKVFRGNVPLIGCFGVLFSYILMTTYFANFVNYFCLYYLEEPTWNAPLGVIRLSCAIVVALMVPILSKRLEKRFIIMIGSGVCIVSYIMLYSVTSFPLLVLTTILYGLGYGGIMTNVYSMIPEVSDYGEWKNGVAAPAFIYAACMFILKVASGLASYFVGFCLELVGYDAALEVQTEATRAGIRLGATIGPIALIVVMVLFTLLLRRLDSKRLMPVLKELEERKEKAAR